MGDDDEPFLTETERRFFEALDGRSVRYLIVGMSAALLQGARGATEDIDIWFENIGDVAIGAAATAAGGFFVTRMKPPMIGGVSQRFDLVLSMSGLNDFATEYRGSCEQVIDGITLRLLPLERILQSKRAANRVKDEPGIHQIEVALRVRAHLEQED